MFSVFNKDFLKIIFIMKLDNVGTSVWIVIFQKCPQKHEELNVMSVFIWNNKNM